MRSIRLKELAVLLAARLIGDPDALICGVNTLDEASPNDLSFLSNSRYVEAMKKSQAGAVCVDHQTAHVTGKNYLVCDHPSSSFQKAIEWLLLLDHSKSAFQGIHPTAVIHSSAKISPNVFIGPYAVVDQDTEIGEGSNIGPHVCIGHGCKIGKDCILHPHSVLRERSILGNRVILQPGAVIGSCGFGYIQDTLGQHIKLEQLGIVILEDDVEIGANTTIDRSRFKETIIRKGSKIDNLCQIAHNVEIGEHNVIAAQTGIAGSAKTGKYVMLGGQVGIVGHIELENQVMVATRGGVSKSLKTGKYRGAPAIPIAEYNRREVHLRKIEEYVERIKELEAIVKKPKNPS
ncbi:MAG TPA: UDP-3-O-(3-hydroxymyristoyl)glucosamine N-acyltransferase [Chlamydiales bacterium]|jgi:UDP-3-O-[3-hydroxymyristoyl] glucosamine N-acyltransferase|nr:UDP-3-O-(3-hydroxymyristoyl)glucosamine N-acyltransferase [Chlamydiales bacterium]